MCACNHAASKVHCVDVSLCKPQALCTRDTSPSRRLPIHKYCNCQWEVGSTSSQQSRRVMAHAPLVRAAPCAPESMAITIARSPHCHVLGAMTPHANLPLPFHEVSSRNLARAGGSTLPPASAPAHHRGVPPPQMRTVRGPPRTKKLRRARKEEGSGRMSWGYDAKRQEDEKRKHDATLRAQQRACVQTSRRMRPQPGITFNQGEPHSSNLASLTTRAGCYTHTHLQ